ncbi:FAD/NAD(P)-binding oxidoreductase [Mesorhizobium argentiipisi]|uniref:FAD/NAD(P)-binding oxidoreductase n=1 Tax=Mesorhizobium argentiipisi TaxID=3015175 RepID=A0ABU8KJH2_9HYPH
MSTASKPRIVVLGAGFGGLELTTLLSEAMGDGIDVTLIDKSDAFVFGFSKLDVMFGLKAAEAVRLPYNRYAKPGVKLLRRTITAIDPERRRVTTDDDGVYDADYLIVALGAEYDFDATPGLSGTNEFYSVAGAERLRDVLPGFKRGRAMVGVCGAPYKCPPAPSECVLMLHDYLVRQGVREACEISLVLPLGSPVPPSPDTSKALLAAFAERGIKFIPSRRIASVDNSRNVAVLDDGTEMPFDLFLGVPKHRVPPVVLESGMSENGWIPVNPRTLETKYENVYAVGDGANTGTPKAGVFAEGAARAVASALVAKLRGSGNGTLYDGFGTCYIEFGGGRIGKVEVDFFSGPSPTGNYYEPSFTLRADKEMFGASRRSRWFGL